MSTPGNSENITSAGLVKFDGINTFSAVTVTNHAALIGAASNGITSVAAGAAGTVLASSSASSDPSFQFVAMGPFGDGSDGSPTWDGSTVILGITPSANTYTLARDIFLASSTINNGISIITNGYRIFVQGTLTNNGTIQWNGKNGTTGGAGGGNLTNANSSMNTNASFGSAGGAGNTGAGSNGTTPSTVTLGGQGGAGGAGGSGGGSAGSLTALTAIMGSIRAFPYFSISRMVRGDGTNQGYLGGTGGGGGGGDATNAGGGGGGGGGGVEVLALYITGTGTISANGGTGGNGAVGGTNCGGGGGGGGGYVVVMSRSVVAGAISGQTITASQGNGGSPTGTGSSGSPGSPGITIILPH